MKLSDQQMEDLVYHLLGTCESIDFALEDLFGEEEIENEDEMHAFIDNRIFCCVVCGWWYETCEMSENCDEWTCSDCGDE